jgi:TRAP-type C4-dicarboxylate transport system permease small subunit
MDRKRFATPWTDRLVGLGRPAAVLLFAGALLMASPGFLVRHSARATDALDWNSAIVVAVVPLFAALMVLHLVAQMLRPDPAADKAAGG